MTIADALSQLRRTYTKSAAPILFLLAVSLSGCSSEPAPQTAKDLEPIPIPDFERLPLPVRQQLLEGQLALPKEQDRKNLNPNELGRLYGEQGRLYLAYELIEASQACFVNASISDPGDYRWHYYLGYLWGREGRTAKSRRSYRRALELRPEYLPTYEALADLMTEAGEIEEAERLLRKVRAAAPDRIYPLIGLGQIAYQRQQYEEAIEYLEKARGLGRESARLYYLLGMVHRAKGDIEKAKAFLQRQELPNTRSYDPLINDLKDLVRSARAFNNLGRQAKLEGRLADSRDAYRKAVDADPENYVYHTNLAVASVQLGDTETAIAHLGRALSLNPIYAVASYNMGVILSNQKRHAEAVPHYRTAVEKKPKYKEAHFNLADALLYLGRIEEAAEHFGQALAVDPLLSTARYQQTLALARLNRWQEARSVLETGYAIQPDNVRLADALARLLAACPQDKQRDGVRALKMAQHLYAQQRTTLSRETLAMALAEAGRFQDAVYLQEATLKSFDRTGNPGLENRLTSNLQSYRAGKPCRQPFDQR